MSHYCIKCKHNDEIRDYRNYDLLSAPHGYFCRLFWLLVDPFFEGCVMFKTK